MSGIDIQSSLEPRSRIDIGRQTGRQTVESRSLQITLLVKISQRNQIVALLAGAVGVEVVLLTITATYGLVVPVQVLAVCTQHLCVAHHLAIGIKQSVVGLVEYVQQHAVLYQMLRCVCTSGSSACTCGHLIVLHVQPLGLHPLAGIQTVVLSYTAAVCTLLYVQVHVQLTLLTLLGGNQDNTVRGAVTIQSSRSSILKYRHALDVLRVQVADVTAIWHTIKYVQWVSVTIHSSHTTDADRGILTRSTYATVYTYTCNCSFQSRSY